MGYAIDFLVALFLVWSLYRGWKLGFLYQLGQLALIALAYVVAKGLDSTVAGPFHSTDVSPQVANTIGFFVLFFAVLLVGGFLLRRMTKDLLSFSKGSAAPTPRSASSSAARRAPSSRTSRSSASSWRTA